MAMRATTVRFSEDLWETLEAEAKVQGVSTAQLIREAAIMRVAALALRRGEPEFHASLAELADRLAGSRSLSPQDGDIRDPERLAALRATGLLEVGADRGLDRLAEAARQVLNAPVGLVTLVDADRQVFLSQTGLGEPWASRGESPLAYSFCAEAAVCREPMVVGDARRDPRVQDNPAIQEMGVVAYLGVPLITRNGHALGALCAIDHQPRVWTNDQVELMTTLAAATVDRMEAFAPSSRPRTIDVRPSESLER